MGEVSSYLYATGLTSLLGYYLSYPCVAIYLSANAWLMVTTCIIQASALALKVESVDV